MTFRQHPAVSSVWRHATGAYLWVVIAALYLAITIFMTWPLPRHAGSAVQDPGDPIFEIWVIRAVQHGLVNHPLSLYDANAFYPFSNSLAYSEEAISTALLVWPVQILTGNDVLAYNVAVLFGFWLIAFGIYLLARELGAHPGAAFLAGVLAAFAPARYAQLSHLHMMLIGWVLLAMWALTVFVRGGRRRYLLLAGVALTMQLLASLHLAVFATLTLGLYLLCLLVFERHRREWTRNDLALLGAALIAPYLIFAPTMLPHFHAGHDYGFVRTREEVERFSAPVRSYLAVSVTNRYWPDWMERRGMAFFPGVVALAGAALALLWARRWGVLFAGALAAIAVTFSLGFSLDVGGRSIPLPYRLVYDWVSPIQNLRVVARFGLLTVIGVPLLAALGYSAAWHRLRPRLRWNATITGITLTALLTLVACVELRATPGTWPVDNKPESMAVYEWLGDLPPGPLVELPANGLIDGSARPPGGIFRAIHYMYGSTRHWHPILNGYSGFIPPRHYDLLRLLRTEGHPSLVTAENVGVLQDLGIRYVVIHRFPDYDWATAIEVADGVPDLRRIGEPGDSVVYEVIARERAPVTARLDTPAHSFAGWHLNARMIWENPNPNLALVHLETDLDTHIVWLNAEGDIHHEETLPIWLPIAAEPGETSVSWMLSTPAEPGDYLLRIEADGDLIPHTEQRVTIEPMTAGEAPLRLESIEWDRRAGVTAGDTLQVEVTWGVLQALDVDLAATLQILDENGERRAGVDLIPGGGMPPTSEWVAGELVRLTFHLPVDASLPPGEYRLMTALYDYQPGFPRLPVILPDGSTATEMTVDGLVVR